MKKLTGYKVPYRAGASSHRFNQTMGYVEEDLAAAYEELRVNNIRLKDVANVFNYGHQALRAQILDLDFLLYTVGFYATDYTGVGVSMFDPGAVVAGTARHTPAYGEMTLPYVEGRDKVAIFQDFRGFRKPIPQVVASISTDGTNYTDMGREDSAYHAINRHHGDAWIYESESSLSQVHYRVTYPTPLNPSVNLVVVDPVPDGIIQVESLKYLNAAGSYVEVPGWVAVSTAWRHHFRPTDVSDSFDLKLSYPGSPVPLRNLDGDSRYVYGLHNVRFMNVDYSASAWGVVEINAETMSYLRSLQVVAEYNTGGSTPVTTVMRVRAYKSEQSDWLNPDVDDLVYDSNTDTYPYTETDTPIDIRVAGLAISKLFVKIDLLRYENVTPVVRGIRITYS